MIKLIEIYPALTEIIESNEKKISQASNEDLLELFTSLHGFYRLKAIGSVLIECDLQRYKKYLRKSGLLRLQYFETWDGDCNSYSCISNSNGFFDLLAIGDFKHAKQIAQHQTNGVCKRHEYEEDYLYLLLLSQIINNIERKEIEFLFERAEKLYEGSEMIRLNICKSLYLKDETIFTDNFQSLLSLRETELLNQERSLARDEIDYLSASNVFIEGLALLSIAKQSELPIEQTYKYCPQDFVVAID